MKEICFMVAIVAAVALSVYVVTTAKPIDATDDCIFLHDGDIVETGHGTWIVADGGFVERKGGE